MDTAATTPIEPIGQSLWKSLSSEVPKGRLYHYTTQNGLLGIINSQEIWATHHQCLNDTQEFLHAKRLFLDEIAKRASADPLLEKMKALDWEKGFENVNLYVTSFSDDGDSLSQWRAYGQPTSGFSLGVEGMVLPDRFTLVRCIYEEKEQREILGHLVYAVAKRLSEVPIENVEDYYLFFQALNRFALLFKNQKFDQELEWRIISDVLMDNPPHPKEPPLKFREGKSMLIPYRPIPLKNAAGQFPLTDLVVGPNPSPEQSVRSVQSLLNSKGLTSFKPRKSKVPFRNW